MVWELVFFLVGTVAISAGCLVPASWLPTLPNDKLLHFLAYGGMALLAGRIAQSSTEFATWLIGLFVAGWAIECLQQLVPGRKFCWRDLAANTAGIVAAGLLSHFLFGT
ncbi:VanZ family protein [Herbaspirillum sp. ST 5-3]|uniref:VanZ family protein n=1 Tax=Oxalobacteraceae TaxID=75682 RepID=UPI0010A5643F|nr:VanZ family protein [Herbaspirillum sp. ST 5-3]